MNDLTEPSRLAGRSHWVTIAITLVIPAICCLPLLVVIDETLRYSIYLFALSLIILVFLRVRNKRGYTFSLRHPRYGRADYFMVSCTAFVFIFNLFGNPLPPVTAVVSTIVVFFVPGWAVMRLLEQKDTRPRKKGILLVLSFAISLFLSSLIFMAASSYPVLLSPVLLSGIYIAISVVPLIERSMVRIRSGYSKGFRSEYDLYDVLLLVWLLAFFSFTISVLYPEMAKVPGLDIVRHFSQVEGLRLVPEIYTSLYPWFHFLLASVAQLSSAPLLAFQTVIAALGFVPIFSFYVMARAYLINIDRRAPILATVIFSVFAGFGWRYFLEKMPNLSDAGTSTQTLDLVFRATYFDIGYGEGSWMWMWFRPVTIGMIILFILLYLPRHERFGRNKYVLVCSMLLIALGQIHFSELVLFILFTFVLALFVPKISFRLKETSLSCLVAVATFLALGYFYPRIFNSEYILYLGQHFSGQVILLIGVLSTLSLILAYYPRRPFPLLKYRFKFVHAVAATLIVLFIYFILLFHWFLDSDSFTLPSILTLLSVPSQFYPMVLGITGIFAIISIPILAKRYKDHPIIIFVVMFVLMILIGRLITYVGSEYAPTGYFERRVIFHVFAASSILAPICLLRIMDIFHREDQVPKAITISNPINLTIISFIILVGTMSTFLTVEYQKNYVAENALSIGEIESLQNHVKSDPYSTLLTESSQSRIIAEFSSPGYLVGAWSKQIWPSETPELPLNILALYNSSFIFTQGSDEELIRSTYPSSFVNSHLLDVAGVVYEGESQKLYRLPRLSPPLPSSTMVLVLPDSNYTDRDSYYAYDMLSIAGYNYTTAPLSDISSIYNAEVVVAPNEAVASKIIQYKNDYNLGFYKLVVLNSDSNYGRIWESLAYLNSSNMLNIDVNFSGWIPHASGLGEIGFPKIIDAGIDNPISGGKAAEIVVGQGLYSKWQMSKVIPGNLQNLTDFDFAYFDWLGRGDGKLYALQFVSSSNHSFWYRFEDSKLGWQRITLPLHVADGKSNTYGVPFYRYTEPKASWSDIVRVNFGPEMQIKNQGGNFYLEGFYFGKELASTGIKPLSIGQTGNDPSGVLLTGNVKLLPYHSKYKAVERALFENTDVPFILEKNLSSNAKLLYVNMLPIVQQVDLIGNSMDALSLPLPKSDSIGYKFTNRTSLELIAKGAGAFSGAKIRGDVNLNSTSAILENVEGSVVLSLDGRTSILENVSRIIPIIIKNVKVESHTGGSLEEGHGFYSSFRSNQSSITATGNPGVILVEFDGEKVPAESKAIFFKNNVMLDISKSTISLRQPEVFSNGTVEFEKFYGYGGLNNEIPNLGQQLKVQGLTSFKIDYSDKFTIMNSASFKGELQSEQSIYPYDELASLSSIFSLPYARHITVVAILLAIVAMYLLDKKTVIHFGRKGQE